MQPEAQSPTAATIEKLVDAVQVCATGLIPFLFARHINTGDKTIDNILITAVTTITSVSLVLLISFFKNPVLFAQSYVHAKSILCRTNDRYVHGFLTVKLPIFGMIVKDTSRNPRVPVYFVSDTYNNKINKIIVWLVENILISDYRPRIEFNDKGTFNTGFHDYNKSGCAYPFYYVGTDYIYWEIYEKLNGGVGLRFSADSYVALKYFLDILKRKDLYSYGSESIDKCLQIKEYELEMPTFVANICEYRVEKSEVVTLGYIRKSINFDSLFFTDKALILKMLDRFSKGTLHPPHVAASNKLGILLHGPPGTGKSAFVSAIANMLKRSVITVDMSKIKTVTQFEQMLRYDRHKYIWFLEEMDCVLGVLKNRSLADDSEQDGESKEMNQLMTLFASSGDGEYKKLLLDKIDELKQRESNSLNLGYILQKLDGITDETGRVIIGCTNHPELIDPALLRPGRLGIKINLGLCTRKMLIDIINHYLPLSDQQKAQLDVTDLPEGKISPCDLIQRIQMYCDHQNFTQTDFDILIHSLEATRCVTATPS